MTSVLRQLQNEWNQLVPAAQARGLRRVRLIPSTRLETIADRRAKLEWLRAQLMVSTALAGPSFGVEIECFRPNTRMTLGQVAAAITAAGVPCREERYGHSVPTGHWKVVTDGSLGYELGLEVVSPPLRGDEGLAQLQKVMKALTDLDCRVNKKCGFHVHVGVASEGLEFFKNLVVLYSSAERAIDSFMAPSRRGDGNAFIRSLQVDRAQLAAARSVAEVAQAAGQSSRNPRSSTRYRKLNLQSFWAYGTVEFRQHQGTVDADKATNWVRLCLRMVLAARAGGKEVTTVDELMTAVEAPEGEAQYFKSRVAFFGRGSETFEAYADQVLPRRSWR